MEKMIHQNLINKENFNTLVDKLTEYVVILDADYSADRESFAQGGYVFFISNCEEAKTVREEIIRCYNLEEKLEFANVFLKCEDTKEIWKEELYLRSSDDAVVIIYPLKREEGES